MARMKVSNEPAIKPGSINGKVTRRNNRKPWQPKFFAASSSDESMFASDTTVLSRMKGKKCSVCTNTTPASPSMNGIDISNQSISSKFTMPLRPRINCNATAPTKGGMTSGSVAAVCKSSLPRNS